LDRRCNPRPPFQAARALNTLLFGEPRSWQASSGRLTAPGSEHGGWLARCLTSDDRAAWLLVPTDMPSVGGGVADADAAHSALPPVSAVPDGPLRLLRLHDATVVTLQPAESVVAHLANDGPAVLWRAPERP
jgi:hypothetical protein